MEEIQEEHFYIWEEFEEHLKALLDKKGWKQADAARAIGVESPTFNKWVKGVNNFRSNKLAELCDKLSLTGEERKKTFQLAGYGNLLIYTSSKQSQTKSQVNNELEYEHPLHIYPLGPFVPIGEVNPEIYKEYAKFFNDPKTALLIVEEVNDYRKRADTNDKTVTVIDTGLIISPREHLRGFWQGVFEEAGRNGPRMLAALLIAVGFHRLGTSKECNTLLKKLETWDKQF